jgi:hypothetical protein
MLAGDLNFINESDLNTTKDAILEVERMLKALIKSLESKC